MSDVNGPMTEDAELRAVEAADDDPELDLPFDRRSSAGRASSTHEPAAGHDDSPRRSYGSEGQVIATAAIAASNPYGDEECCGVCLENPGPESLVFLWCCRNVLCVRDAQLVGTCPFCREEPVMWDLKRSA
jgi:hypothetical protein